MKSFVEKNRKKIFFFSIIIVLLSGIIGCSAYPNMKYKIETRILAKQYGIKISRIKYRGVQVSGYTKYKYADIYIKDFQSISPENRNFFVKNLPYGKNILEGNIISEGKIFSTDDGLTTTERDERTQKAISEKDYNAVKELIQVRITYKTWYLSGVREYGIEITNNSPYDVVIDSIDVKSSDYHDKDVEKLENVNFHVKSGKTEEDYRTIGFGKREKGGSMTSKGNVYGGDAYVCKNFTYSFE